MGSVPPLLTYLLLILSGWVHRRQLVVIEFLQADNQLLKARLSGKRIRFTEAERALLARKAKAVGRRALLELDTLVSPDTLTRWQRRLVAQKWDFSKRRGPGRPGIMREISQLIVRMAREKTSAHLQHPRFTGTHYHEERNHQGLENRLIRGIPSVAENEGAIHRRPRLGGMLNYYYRAVA